MAIVKVLPRGQVTLPSELRKRAGIQPGDTLSISVVGTGQLEVMVLPRLSPRELRERYPIIVPIDEPADRAAWEATAAEDVLGRNRD